MSATNAPVPPEDWECCGSGCGDACVWEMYYREKAAYEAQLRQTAIQAAAAHNGLPEHTPPQPTESHDEH